MCQQIIFLHSNLTMDRPVILNLVRVCTCQAVLNKGGDI